MYIVVEREVYKLEMFIRYWVFLCFVCENVGIIYFDFFIGKGVFVFGVGEKMR